MHRQTIVWNRIPSDVRLRGCTNTNAAAGPPVEEPPPVKPPVPVAATFPNESGQPVPAAPPPPPDIRPLLETIAERLRSIDERRQQALEELQQVAIELSVAVASYLVHTAIDRGEFGVEHLVRQAVDALGLDNAPVVSLHPTDLQLLQKRLLQQPPPWELSQVTFEADPGIARGGCRVEDNKGRVLVSDISLRLSDIRRHWMEELDDTQVERRGASGEGPSLRRFPDRREIA